MPNITIIMATQLANLWVGSLVNPPNSRPFHHSPHSVYSLCQSEPSPPLLATPCILLVSVMTDRCRPPCLGCILNTQLTQLTQDQETLDVIVARFYSSPKDNTIIAVIFFKLICQIIRMFRLV